MKRALYQMAPAPDSRAYFVAEGIVGLVALLLIGGGGLMMLGALTLECVNCGGL